MIMGVFFETISDRRFECLLEIFDMAFGVEDKVSLKGPQIFQIQSVERIVTEIVNLSLRERKDGNTDYSPWPCRVLLLVHPTHVIFDPISPDKMALQFPYAMPAD